jgi:flagellar biosynthesis protein FlhG
MKPIEELDHYEVLEVARGASSDEIGRAFALVRATYEDDSLAAYSVFDPDDAKRWRERIEEAFGVLSDSDARRRYDARLAERDAAAPAAAPASAALPEPAPPALPEDPGRVAAVRPAAAPAAQAPIPIEEPPAPAALSVFEEEDPEAPWDGARLRRSRLARGIELAALASATKINPTYLRFLEEERFDELPAAVYVRGFVTAYARHLGLDAARVIHDYAQRLEEQRRARPKGRLLGRR